MKNFLKNFINGISFSLYLIREKQVYNFDKNKVYNKKRIYLSSI